MPEPLTIGTLINLITAGEQILDILEHAEGIAEHKLLSRMRLLTEGDSFTRGPNVREISQLANALTRLHIYLKRIRAAEIGGGS